MKRTLREMYSESLILQEWRNKMKNKNILSIMCLAAASALLFGCSENTSPEAIAILESRQEETAAVMASGIISQD